MSTELKQRAESRVRSSELVRPLLVEATDCICEQSRWPGYGKSPIKQRGTRPAIVAGMTYDTDKAEALMEKLAAENVAKIQANKMCAEGIRTGRTWKPYVVKFSHMVAAMKAAGLKYPTDYITLAAWLRPIADKVLPKYRRQLKRPNTELTDSGPR